MVDVYCMCIFHNYRSVGLPDSTIDQARQKSGSDATGTCLTSAKSSNKTLSNNMHNFKNMHI